MNNGVISFLRAHLKLSSSNKRLAIPVEATEQGIYNKKEKIKLES